MHKIAHTVTSDGKSIWLNGNLIFQIEDIEIDTPTQYYRQKKLQYPKFFKMDIASKWGIVCAEILMHQIDLQHINPFKKCIILGNTSASLHTDTLYSKTMQEIPQPAIFVYTLPNIVMGEIAIKWQWKGENTFLVLNKENKKDIDEMINYLFANDIAEVVLGGFFETFPGKEDIELSIYIR